MNVTLDTETTGLPPKGTHWEKDFMQFPYIVQLSWKRSDQNNVNDFIINNGVDIPESATAIHGITTEMANQSQISFMDIIPEFMFDCLNAEKIIAHNGYFDISIIKANLFRFYEGPLLRSQMIRALHKDKRVDTMMKTIKFCAIPFPNGRGLKWPKLEELYIKLFNESFPAHNAKEDVLATERCYLELVKRGII